MHIPLTGEDLDIYLRIEVTIVYKIVNMDLTHNFLAMLSCTYNYKSIRSKSNFYRYIFLRFFMSGLLVNLYSSIDKAAVREKKLHYILKDSILL